LANAVGANRQEDVAVNMRMSAVWATAAGLALACPALGLAQAPAEPGRLGMTPGSGVSLPTTPPTNQQVADAVARQLRASGRLEGYAIDIGFADGVAELTGRVADEAQRDEAVRIARSVPGVELVRDCLTLADGAAVTPAQAVMPQPPQPPQPPVPPTPPGLMPRTEGTPPLAGGAPGEPAPIFQAHPAVPGLLNNPPPMPPYAWPTYAPYNNYSRVATPIIYPYQSWPFVGPMYPFPKIPLGWRSVKLTWEDGHWWYARVGSGHDWWRIRYW
jgi:hypothetical protein